MTAELFVKLTAQLYAERKHLLEDEDRSSVQDHYSISDTEDDESGGAPLNPPDIDGFSSHGMSDDLPPERHATQLNRLANPYSILDDELEDNTPTPTSKQWIPSMESSFWDIYANKLRVNASKGGVCDLEETED
jgi:hypothetical protein